MIKVTDSQGSIHLPFLPAFGAFFAGFSFLSFGVARASYFAFSVGDSFFHSAPHAFPISPNDRPCAFNASRRSPLKIMKADGILFLI